MIIPPRRRELSFSWICVVPLIILIINFSEFQAQNDIISPKENLLRSLIYELPSNDDSRWNKRGQRGYNMWRKGKRDSLIQPYSRNELNDEVIDELQLGESLNYPIYENYVLNHDDDDDQQQFEAPEVKRSYKDWRKGKKRSYRDWRKGKRDRNDINQLMEMTRRTSSGSNGFKQWRKMG